MADHYFTRDFSLDDIPAAELVAAQPRPGSGKSLAQFFVKEVKDDALSTARNRYVPRLIDMIKVIIPGDRHSIVERRVRPSDKTDYPRQYEAFKKQQEFVPDGTPIESWPMIGRSQIYELKAAGIFTVEAIAALSDENLPALGLGARLLRKHAESFLAASEKGKPSAHLVSENEILKNQVTLLTRQLSDLATKFEASLVKAGGKAEDVANPITEIRQQIAENAGVAQKNVEIPHNYQRLGVMDLRNIVRTFSDAVVASKQDALEMIGEYLAKRDSVAV